MVKQRRKPWQKTLYGNEGYADNYTNPRFLKDLQTNINVEIFQFPEAILGATKLTHQISLVIAFLLVFYNLYAEPHFIEPEMLLFGASGTTVVGYVIYVIQNYRQRDHTLGYFQMLRKDMKTVLSILVFGFILSPMLHTLTKSISTDTIFNVTFCVFLLHLVCFDYGLPASIVSNAISLNAIVFGTLCLASRLTTSFHAFVLLVVAVELFALYPCVLNSFQNSSIFCVRLMPVVLISTITCYCLMKLSTILFFIYLILWIFCGFIYPVIFCYVQRYKNNIHGPWDEAVVDVTVNI